MRHVVIPLLERFAMAVFVLLLAATLVFVAIHLGVQQPVDATGGAAGQQELADKKQAFGLDRPLSVQYVDYVTDMFTLEFGETWTQRDLAIEEGETSTDVNAIVYHRMKRTGWLWLWSGLLAAALITVGGLVAKRRESSARSIAGGLAIAPPAFLVAIVFQHAFFNLETLLLGLDWRSFLAPTPSTITRPIPVDALGSIDGVLLASKLAIPPALALALPLAATTTLLLREGFRGARTANFVALARTKGLRSALVELKHVLPNAVLPVALVAGQGAGVLIGGTVIVELIFELDGLGSLFFTSVVRNDYTTLQATVFVLVGVVVAVAFLADIATVFVTGSRQNGRRRQLTWTAPWTGSEPSHHRTAPRRLRSVGRDADTITALVETPRPAAKWLAAGGVLFLLEIGAVVGAVGAIIPGFGLPGYLPTLLTRDLISNTGYQLPTGAWVGTFLGLPPAYAWALRVAVVYLYACLWLAWLWAGYQLYLTVYRPTEWSPTDTVIARFRQYRVGQFGFVVVFVVVVAALFAPTLGPATPDQTNAHTSLGDGQPSPAGTAELTYFDEQADTVQTTTVGTANAESGSTTLASVGPMSYDKFGRFHPFGTTYSGTDLFTEMLHGARVYLVVAGGAMLLASAVALAMSGLTSVTDRLGNVAIAPLADALALLPTLPFVFLLSGLFYPKLYSVSTQLLVWAVLFGLLGWPRLWQTIQVPLDRVTSAAWVDAELAVGQSKRRIGASTARHVLGPLSVYALVGAAGVVITTAALSYIGHIAPATPYSAYEWGSLAWRGEQFLLSDAGHLFVIPAVALIVLVAGLNALAAGLREAIELPDGSSVPGELGRLGGGG